MVDDDVFRAYTLNCSYRMTSVTGMFKRISDD